MYTMEELAENIDRQCKMIKRIWTAIEKQAR